MEPNRGRTNRRFIGTNPPAGAQIFYALTVKANAVELKVVDADGKEVRELKASTDPGLHQVSWDLARPARGGAALQPGQRQPRQGGGGVPAARQAVKPGEYRVVLKVDGVEMVQPLRVEADPTAPGATTVLEEEVEEDRVID
jgi:hypothetical protein